MIKRKVIKRIVTEGLKAPVQYVRRHKAKAALTQLTSHSDPTLKAIGIALQETLSRALSTSEEESISRIEQRRSFLLKSDQKIDVVDYGAGSPRSDREEEAMARGIQSTAFVADISTRSKSSFWATCLFKFIRNLRPQSCVELGTCVGISAAYQAAALSINGNGSIVTLEGSPEIANIAVETFEDLGYENVSVVTGPFHQTLENVLATSSPIDFFFNDGHHDHDAVIRYFNQAIPYLSDGGVIVFDDISWSAGMRKAWSEIEEDERVSASIDLRTIGIAVVKRDVRKKANFRIAL